MPKNLTRTDLATAIYNKIGLSHTESFKIIDQIIVEVIQALKNGDSVKIANFATFEPHSKKSRLGRNPKTKETFPISERTVVSFKPSKTLKKGIL